MRIVYPNFTKGRILKIEMLENLRDYSRDALDVLTNDLSDGIVKGLDANVNKNIITFAKGIVKYKGKVYLISENISIDYETTDVEVVIKLVFLEESLESDYRIQYISVILDKDTIIKENEVELGRFKLKDGAYLRTDYKDLDDYTTEFNTINLINVHYAYYENHTLTPKFMKSFGREILKTKTKDIWDINFGTSCVNFGTISRDLIIEYINSKLDEDNKSFSNDEIHKKLIVVLEKVREENKFEKNNIRIRKTILVD